MRFIQNQDFNPDLVKLKGQYEFGQGDYADELKPKYTLTGLHYMIYGSPISVSKDGEVTFNSKAICKLIQFVFDISEDQFEELEYYDAILLQNWILEKAF